MVDRPTLKSLDYQLLATDFSSHIALTAQDEEELTAQDEEALTAQGEESDL